MTDISAAARRLRYLVAVSLDGFIADANGGYDWIVKDPGVDFKALYAQFDTVVMGRKTFDLVAAQGGSGAIPGMDVFVFSRTLPPATRTGVTITADDPAHTLRELKTRAGRDIWLFGGGVLFRALADAGVVDAIEVAVMPVLLGSGVPLVPPGPLTELKLADHKVLARSGIVVLAYSLKGSEARPPRIAHITSQTLT